MKFDCGPTAQEKYNAKHEWHDWFAWYPVRVDSHDCRWLETVERKGKFSAWPGSEGWQFEYRAKEGG